MDMNMKNGLLDHIRMAFAVIYFSNVLANKSKATVINFGISWITV